MTLIFDSVLSILLFSVLASADNFSRCTDKSTNATIECYNGDCVGASCVCHQGWTGDKCHECNGRVLLDGNSGFITDGHLTYAKGRECSWILQPKHTGPVQIRLRIDEFASECGWDYLYVYDGDSAYSPLLATFNGLHTIDKEYNYRPEVVAQSGKAFVHFYSDAEYVMKGFNISYTLFGCPQNCSTKGFCNENDNVCICNAGWTGSACEVELCPSNCSAQESNGYCFKEGSNSVGECVCGREDLGCSSNSSLSVGVWNILDYSNSSAVERASHSGIIYKDTMWIYGGIQFGQQPFSTDFQVYNFTSTTWNHVESGSPSPTLRYGHSMVLNGSSIYVFGGREVLSGVTSDELWTYDIELRSWRRIMYQLSSNMILPQNLSLLMVWGHTANIIELLDGRTVMIVLFGYQTEYGFSGFVWEYDLNDERWTRVVTNGALIEGAYGHTTTWDPVSRLCFVHGGFSYIRAGVYGISAALHSYQPDSKTFKVLRPSGIPRFLHTAVLIDNMLLLYGGCTHNDTQHSTGALCFSASFMSYHTTCDTWQNLPDVAWRNHGKYGHVALPYNEPSGVVLGMVLNGGYNGEVHRDTLLYQVYSCAAYSTEESCSENRGSFSCVWNVSTSSCSHSTTSASCVNGANSYCESIGSCFSCNNANQGCVWCDKKCKKAGTCDGEPGPCRSGTESHCLRFRTCQQCKRNEECQWQKNSCTPRVNNATAQCLRDPCGTLSTCSSCLNQPSPTCMWCTNRQVCVSTVSYVVQFPYGECAEWISNGNQCPADTLCRQHETCSSCLSDPFCGWCDDGSRTGLGTCSPGTLSGAGIANSTQNVISYDIDIRRNATCNMESWYFSTCPICQCNGHSTCLNGTSKCIYCQDQTTGDQCEKCVDGYFGQSLNGGLCKPCQCYGRAKTCDQSSGACFCSTKGVSGARCDKCDTDSKYFGDPTKDNGTCFYRLLINYSFTFTLTMNQDSHVTAINFENTPPEYADADLDIQPDGPCDIRLTVAKFYRVASDSNGSSRSNLGSVQVQEEVITVLRSTRSLTYSFSGSEYGFGNPATNATIRIYVSNFTVPTLIKVSLVQKSNQLLFLLLILFSSFLGLLVVIALLWKFKLMYDGYQHRRQHAEELEQMATRPFATIFLDVDETGWSSKNGSDILVATEEASECGKSCISTVALWLPYNGDGEACVDKKFGIIAMGSTLLNRKPVPHEVTRQTEKNGSTQHKKFRILFKNRSKSRPSLTRTGNLGQSSTRDHNYDARSGDSTRYSSSLAGENRRTEGPCAAPTPSSNAKHPRIESFSPIAPKSDISPNDSTSQRDASHTVNGVCINNDLVPAIST